MRAPNRRRLLVGVAPIAVASLMALAACGGGGGSNSAGGSGASSTTSGPALTKPAITIGEVAQLTGPAGFFGTEGDRGVQLGIDRVNATGGINGAPLKVDTSDDQTNPSRSSTLASKYINDTSYPALIGMTGTVTTLTWAKDAVAAHLPVLSLSAAAATTNVGDSIFEVQPPDANITPQFVKATLKKLKIKKVAFLWCQDDPNTQSNYKVLKQSATDNGAQIVADESYLHTATDWSAQILKIKQAKPDAVVAVALSQEPGSVLLQARQLGLTMPFIGSASYNSLDLLKQDGTAANGLYVGDYWSTADTGQENKDFMAAYKKKFAGAEPSRFATIGYNAVMLTAQAMKKASDPKDRTQVLAALQAINSWQFLGAKMTMTNRAPTPDTVYIITAKDGKFVPAGTS